MLKKKCYFSYTNYEEIDSDGNRMNVIVTGPKVITKTGMFNYCWPGCLTVMYDRKKIGLIQIEDIKKNNDYAMWLKICKKNRCYLLDEFSLPDAFDPAAGQAATGPMLLVGSLICFVLGYISIAWLLKFVSNHSFSWFAAYRIPVGLLVMLLLVLGVLQPY